MKIAIVGTRGIPNYYGGFEQFAEYLSLGLVKKGYNVTVYNSNKHPYQLDSWNGVRIVHKYDPENKIGTAGQFIYDLSCILDARKQNYDLILQLGYTSNSIWGWLLPKRPIIVTNMDGLEWKRSKYSKYVRNFLKSAESWAVKTSDFYISDSVGIQNYLKDKYEIDSEFIPYGASIFSSPDFEKVKNKFEYLAPNEYDMLIARMEPENNIETILEAKIKTIGNRLLLVIGSMENKFGTYLKQNFGKDPRIIFLGSIYNLEILNNLRYFSNIYFHGHSVGGTNPSLLEAMASGSFIIAHKNTFNETILGKDAFYFKNVEELALLIEKVEKQKYNTFIDNNLKKIKTLYNWPLIIEKYEKIFTFAIQNGKKKS